MFGIDVAKYQGEIDWEKVNVGFAILKITQKDNTAEESFERNYKEATIPVGGYKYVYAKTVEEASKEAHGVVEVCKGKSFPYGIWLDMEDKTIKTIGKQNLTNIIITEAEILKANGYDVGIYCNYDWWKNVLDSTTLSKKFPFWIARYKHPDLGTYDESWKNNPKDYAVMWQYSSKGNVGGIKGNVDMDVLFVPIEEVFGKKVEDMKVVIGSARIDENGKLTGGKAGDQTGKEVSTQTFYMHSKGWIGLRAKDSALAEKLAKGMQIACDNPNIGYDQNERLGVVRNGIESKVKTECDCSSLVRAVLKYAGVEVCNFTTSTAKAVIMSTGLFDEVKINSAADVTNGMILCTKTKGHIVIVISGAEEKKSSIVDNPYPEPTKTLNKGAKGDSVRWVQYELKKRGYDLGRCGIDGDYGSATVKAVKSFQRSKGLVVDGITGKNTIKALKQS